MSTQSFLPILVTRQTCRLCGSKALTDVIDLGDQFISGSFADPKGAPPVNRRIPLEVVRCNPAADENACGLVQLRHSVPPPILYRSYWYRSGVNQTMRDNLSEIAQYAEKTAKLAAGDLVLDIGCNDGTLLNAYETEGIDRLGIDPSKQMSAIAKESGLKVVNDFFSDTAFYRGSNKKAKVVTSIAMFYDLEDPNAFVDNVHQVLSDNGIWILELSYLPMMLAKNSFDTICHEHLEYYSLAPLERVLSCHDMAVLDVTLNGINGGSFRVTVAHTGHEQTEEQAERVQALRISEFEMSLDTDEPYEAFLEGSNRIQRELEDLLGAIKEKRQVVHGYGASTKGNTILQFCAINTNLLPVIADRNPAKWGSHTIGTNIPIISEEDSRAMKPDYYLVLPWHFMDEFRVREKEFLDRGGKFIVPMPEVRIID